MGIGVKVRERDYGVPTRRGVMATKEITERGVCDEGRGREGRDIVRGVRLESGMKASVKEWRKTMRGGRLEARAGKVERPVREGRCIGDRQGWLVEYKRWAAR